MSQPAPTGTDEHRRTHGEQPRHFDADFEAQVCLRDGRLVHVAPLHPAHAPELQQAFRGLSTRSRYMRFMTARRELSPEQLRYLTTPDGERHFALAACLAEPGGRRGVAVARFIQLPDEPTAVEPAITVVDDVQGLGLGTQLIRFMVAAARERGYAQISAEILSENRPMLQLLRRTGAPVELQGFGTALTARLRLSPGSGTRLSWR